ncbi:hypothetical protein L9F63_000452 [Diploptera punctata]|uniref:Uncharacterized protein n=1 Tax=Diploptera punctata TaxID=6984 RepID=A0AAD8ALR7_DIPPU|nr:hypothetical protein L9F63_000452 [Diploptera punctata]
MTTTIANCSGRSINDSMLINIKFENSIGLETVDFSGNNLTSLCSDTLSTILYKVISSIKKLNISNNMISDIHKLAFQGLNKMHSLDLSRNNISNIERSLFKELENCTELDLSCNKITQIGHIFNELVNLERLLLSNNRITDIPKDLFKKQARLVFLDISGNRLTIIRSETFASCASLEKLLLTNNNIYIIDMKAFYGLKRIMHLDLSNNSLFRIRTVVFNVSSVLEEESEENNKNTISIPMDGNESEGAGSNSVKEFSFVLNLSANKLSKINFEELFVLLHSVNTTINISLDLRNNTFDSLDINSVKWMKKFNVFPNFSGNPWDCCNTNLISVFDELKNNLTLFCEKPEEYKGEPWDNYNITKICSVSDNEITNVTEPTKKTMITISSFSLPCIIVYVYSCIVIIFSVVVIIVTKNFKMPEDEFWWEDKLEKRNY